jgi:hypothetical protein
MSKASDAIAKAGMSYKEVGEKLGISRGAVWYCVKRGMRPTKGALGERNARRMAEKYAKAIGVDAKSLLEDDHEFDDDGIGDNKAEVDLRYRALLMVALSPHTYISDFAIRDANARMAGAER